MLSAWSGCPEGGREEQWLPVLYMRCDWDEPVQRVCTMCVCACVGGGGSILVSFNDLVDE